jgi:hypothetical protein
MSTGILRLMKTVTWSLHSHYKLCTESFGAGSSVLIEAAAAPLAVPTSCIPHNCQDWILVHTSASGAGLLLAKVITSFPLHIPVKRLTTQLKETMEVRCSGKRNRPRELWKRRGQSMQLLSVISARFYERCCVLILLVSNGETELVQICSSLRRQAVHSKEKVTQCFIVRKK